MLLKFFRVCCEREPVIVVSCLTAAIGVTLPLLVPGPKPKSSYRDRLEAHRAAVGTSVPADEYGPKSDKLRRHINSSVATYN